MGGRIAVSLFAVGLFLGMALDLIALRRKRSKVAASCFKGSCLNFEESKQFSATEAVIIEANYGSNLKGSLQNGGVDGERSRLQPQLQSESELLKMSQYSVLIVDDDEDNLLFAHYAVEQLGYQVAVASSGSEAITTAFSLFPDIILLDIMLRDISGIEVLQHLRQHKQFEAVPIIAVTALAHDRDRVIAMAAGFSDYLIKPYMLDDLEAMIKQHLHS